MEGAKIWMINILEDETAQAHSKKGSTVVCRNMNMLYLLYKDTISSGHLEHGYLFYLRVVWAIACSGGGGWLRTVGGESTALTRARPASMWGLINIPIHSHHCMQLYHQCRPRVYLGGMCNVHKEAHHRLNKTYWQCIVKTSLTCLIVMNVSSITEYRYNILTIVCWKSNCSRKQRLIMILVSM